MWAPKSLRPSHPWSQGALQKGCDIPLLGVRVINHLCWQEQHGQRGDRDEAVPTGVALSCSTHMHLEMQVILPLFAEFCVADAESGEGLYEKRWCGCSRQGGIQLRGTCLIKWGELECFTLRYGLIHYLANMLSLILMSSSCFCFFLCLFSPIVSYLSLRDFSLRAPVSRH